MMTARAALEEMIAEELAQPSPPGAYALADRLRERHGPVLRAVLMYGSNLRQHDDREGVLDLYALVTSYRAIYRNPVLVAANRLLPPNVFYLETETARGMVRCKYAVLALDDLSRLTARHTSEPYFWARFAQPCALVWAADEESRVTVATALAAAVATFVRFAVPFVGTSFDSRALWTTAWQATYGAEIRPERPGAAVELYASNANRFERATALVVPTLPWAATTVAEADGLRFQVDLPMRERRRALGVWRRRRLRAKALFLLRILRNAVIFEGGVDYVLWKIQRHSGVSIDQAWRQKRHPLLALGAEAWRLYRARAFR
jgi:hypothetical protein